MSSAEYRIIITPGDIDGIGFEVSAKALVKLGPQSKCNFFLWSSVLENKKYLKLLSSKFDLIFSDSLDKSLVQFSTRRFSKTTLFIISSASSPAKWVEDSAIACFRRNFHGLVTGPLSKKLIVDSGLSDIGHTDILKRVSKTENVYMSFLGNKFNVVLATAHIPLDQVSRAININSLHSVIDNTLNLRDTFLKSKKPIALLGLNPHAGEGGLLGSEEQYVINEVLRKYKKNLIFGPLSPDAAFLKTNWKKYSFFVCLYHDQGLIPFKLVHGHDSGVHFSLGLPFIRTSVDHGTAKDIFGKNIANSKSMIDAIQTAIRFIKK